MDEGFHLKADSAPTAPPGPPLEDDEPEAAARRVDAWDGLKLEAEREAARWKLGPRRRRCPTLERVAGEMARSIFAAVARLREAQPDVKLLSDHERWLVEGRALLRSTIAEARRSLKACSNLPQIEPGAARRERLPRTYLAAAGFLRSTGYVFDEQAFEIYFAAIQERGPFCMVELWSLKPMLTLVLVGETARTAAALAGTPAPPGLGEDSSAPPSNVSIEVLITSLREIADADWRDYVELIDLTARALREDPEHAYGRMDFESRNLYLKAVSELARHSECDEVDIAKAAIELCRLTESEWNSEPRLAARRHHVGYYLIDHGRKLLEHKIGYKPPLLAQLQDGLRTKPDAAYLVGVEILTIAVMAFILNGLQADVPLVWALLLLLVPATEAAVGAMNQIVSFLLPPRALARLDFSEGIPSDCTTLVAVPTLMTNETQVRQMVRELELRYLANQDPNLHFALLTDFPDSQQPSREQSSLLELAMKLIDELNERYAAEEAGSCFLFHRDAVYNPSESAWMGWERKRGKLMNFNNLLRGRSDDFPVKAGNLAILPELLPKVRYVITLDADTQLPRGSAQRLAGTMAHPLNRAIIDPGTNTVVEGYGILQPRVGISVRSVNRSRLASIYSGQAGFDIYTRAVSDVYQDLLDEGSFTGKGIYEVEVFHRVLSHRFPENTILSHDLIEGAYCRAGLVSDIELIDDYPSHFSAYSRRKHRWVRGDWQIMRWLLPRVPDYYGNKVKNPLSAISKWKILDNLRRSLVEPATFVLLLAGWFFLPGGPVHWTLAVLALLLIPSYLRLILALSSMPQTEYRPGLLGDAAEAFVADQLNIFMFLAFLAQQMLVTLDAIVRTVVRLTITRRRLLEWETAADAEAGTGRRTLLDIYMQMTPIVAAAIAVLLLATHRNALPVAAPILGVWASSGLLSTWLNRPLGLGGHEATPDDKQFLRVAALRTWSYFQTFCNQGNHWLVADNVQEEGLEIAERLSPTNLGMLLNARVAAYELGYLTLDEFVAATEQTLASMRQMATHRGHFFNWYDTATLEPLPPLYISTVDSGNLACCLWTLKQSCWRLADSPVSSPRLRQGVADHVRLILELAEVLPPRATIAAATGALRTALGSIEANDLAPADLAVVERALAELNEVIQSVEYRAADQLGWWIQATLSRLSALRASTDRAGPGLCGRLHCVAAECDALVREMDFTFLYCARRKVLSVGYDTSRARLERSCYDLLASEARTAAFVAIAKGDVPYESWFHLGRTLTECCGRRALLSWSGTMFEYLMPVLWMKSFPRTILDETARSVVDCQRYALKRDIPWGISESACSRKNSLGHYLYLAFGLRGLALRPEPHVGAVISPYSSFLALGTNAAAAVHNLRRMHALGWIGRYGFYEAADYAAAPAGQRDSFELVRSWMAHHQGMILLAVCNLVSDSAIQNVFHAEPRVAASERLLHERLPRAVRVEHEQFSES